MLAVRGARPRRAGSGTCLRASLPYAAVFRHDGLRPAANVLGVDGNPLDESTFDSPLQGRPKGLLPLVEACLHNDDVGQDVLGLADRIVLAVALLTARERRL